MPVTLTRLRAMGPSLCWQAGGVRIDAGCSWLTITSSAGVWRLRGESELALFAELLRRARCSRGPFAAREPRLHVGLEWDGIDDLLLRLPAGCCHADPAAVWSALDWLCLNLGLPHGLDAVLGRLGLDRYAGCVRFALPTVDGRGHAVWLTSGQAEELAGALLASCSGSAGGVVHLPGMLFRPSALGGALAACIDGRECPQLPLPRAAVALLAGWLLAGDEPDM